MAISIYNVVKASPEPISAFDLQIKISRRRKKKIDVSYFNLAHKILDEVEIVNGDKYQIKFEYLSSLADQAYRILNESNEPMHLQEIFKDK